MEGLPDGPVVKTLLPLQGARVQSLVRDLRSHMPSSVAKKKKKRPHRKYRNGVFALEKNCGSSSNSKNRVSYHVNQQFQS